MNYTFREREFDFRHLLIVFSGFSAVDQLQRPLGNYDFQNALSHFPGRIVWIDDSFDGAYGYYLLSKGKLGPRDAVQEFIAFLREEYELGPDDITVTGFSKGGSAALYHGIAAGIRNIVVSVPQMRIGSYLVKNWPKVADEALGVRRNEKRVNEADGLLEELVRTDKDRDRFICVLSSKKDPQFEAEIAPYLELFRLYSGFTLVETESAFVREHVEVTRHHVSLLLGLYYLLANELQPRFAKSTERFCGAIERAPVNAPSESPVAEIDVRELRVDKNRLFLQGALVLCGYPQKNYSDVSYTLELVDDSGRVAEFKLGSLIRSFVTREFNRHSGCFVPYDSAYFATLGLCGVDCGGLAPGRYVLRICARVASNNWLPVRVPIQCMRGALGSSNNPDIRIEASPEGASVIIRR